MSEEFVRAIQDIESDTAALLSEERNEPHESKDEKHEVVKEPVIVESVEIQAAVTKTQENKAEEKPKEKSEEKAEKKEETALKVVAESIDNKPPS